MALMSFSAALEAALSLARPLPSVQVPLAQASGCLAEDLLAPRELPGCDNSAMDGYALRAEETRGATRERPARFTVVETIYAGMPPRRTLAPGEAARIFTGAAVPAGADTVVRQEAAVARGGEVEVVIEAAPGQNVRRKGEEIARDAPLFRAGHRIDPYTLGVLASLGLRTVAVRTAPRVALLTVGDELLEPGTPAQPWQSYDSNGLFLRGLAAACNARITRVGRAPDEVEGLRSAVREALDEADVLITSGGASVGDRDLVKRVLRELGAELVVDGVALKPGKPVGVARVGGKYAVVLPGNPGAAAVAFDQLARPLLWALQGAFEVRPRLRARLDGDRHKQAGLTYFLSAKLEWRGGEPCARVRPQGAGQLLQNVALDGFVVLPPGRADFQAGEWVELEQVHGSTFLPLAARQKPERASPPRVAAVSVVGWSGAGKTTLVEALVGELRARGVRVAVVKHTSHPHPVHKPGSDTERFTAAGAAGVALFTPETVQLTLTASPEPLRMLEELASRCGAELVLVEGWKEGPLPKIVVEREGQPAPEVQGEVLARVQGRAAPDPAAVRELVDLVLSACGRTAAG